MKTAVAVAAATANINFGLTEVVNVFVARWEESLFARKEQLNKDYKATESNIDQLDKEVVKTVDQSKYAINIDELDLVAKVTSVQPKWNDSNNDDFDDDEVDVKKKNVLVISITVQPAGSKNSYNSLNVTKYEPINKKTVDRRQQLVNLRKTLHEDIIRVNDEIKSISRKERQIRGKLSEKKLKELGFEGMINDKEMLKLVQL